MKRNEYFKRAADLYGSGQVSGEVYDAMMMKKRTRTDTRAVSRIHMQRLSIQTLTIRRRLTVPGLMI